MRLPRINSAFTFDLLLIVIFALLGYFVEFGFYIAAVPFLILLPSCSTKA